VVSRRLPAATVNVRSQSQIMWNLCCQSDNGVRFSKYFGLPCQFLNHGLLYTHSIFRSWYNRPTRGRSNKCTHPIPRTKLFTVFIQTGTNGIGRILFNALCLSYHISIIVIPCTMAQIQSTHKRHGGCVLQACYS
jgi:hypothetical protein